jgi:WD40 repeat protein
MAEGKVMQTAQAGPQIRALAMSPDGKLAATGGDDGLIQLWEVDTGKPGAKLTDSSEWVLCLTFSPDNKHLAAGYYDGSIRLWDVAGAKKIADMPAKPNPPPKEAPEPTPTHSLAFTPDGKVLAQGRGDGLIQFLNVADGKVLRVATGHGSAVTGMAFHASGKVLASSSKDRTVRLCNAENGQAIKTLEGHAAWVEGITFLANGTRIATVGADHTVRLWDLAETPKK